ncbi:GNAT family N-acetyltransferase [Paenibacillus sp. 1011MAR3C5]|uniref:GNAT family N-acetyltransferase n=1 Tax=Paenibacillus sp. 1011MAR3C5 TaxID=1675787 RepID=UPI000E6C44BC|nr:GNAT family N-acetyltransferase [Paenibacillus sp. 1011MAR3C5]RJE89790.1 GNAT family N-acetyltransferase [Paenibacillus sp. 1011MAR3C5]
MDIRAMKREDLKEAAVLANRIFREPGHSSMADAFPPIFSGAYQSSLGLYVDGKLVAFMGLVPHLLRIGKAEVPMFALGSVCTDPEHQGKGYAGLLLDHIFAHMEASGASLLYVSGAGKLYARNGCKSFGSTRKYRLHAGMASMDSATASAEGIHIREAVESDRFQLHNLYKETTVRYERSLLETGVLMQAEAIAGIYMLEHRVLVAFLDERIIAYAVLAVRGNHMNDAVPFMVEGAGDAGALEQLLLHALRTGIAEELEVTIPWHEHEWRKTLDRYPYADGAQSGTIRIVSPERFWRSITPYMEEIDDEAASQISVHNMAVPSGEDRAVRLKVGQAELTLTQNEWISLLFDDAWDIPSITEEQGAILKRLLPIPTPYPAGLNFV